MLSLIGRWIKLRFSPRKLSTAEREYRLKLLKFKHACSRKIDEEWRNGSASAHTLVEVTELREWLQHYEETKQKKELQEESEYLAALAELDAEIPRQ